MMTHHFHSKGQGDVIMPHDNPIFISDVIAKHPIEQILTNNDSSVNLIY